MRHIAEKDMIIGGILINEGDQIERKDNKIIITRESEAYNRDKINEQLDSRLYGDGSSVEFELDKIQGGPIFMKLQNIRLDINRPSKSDYKDGWSVFNWNRIKMKYTNLYDISQHGEYKFINSPMVDIEAHSNDYSSLNFNNLIFFDTDINEVHCIAVKKDMGKIFAQSLSEQFRLPVILIKFKMTYYEWMRAFPNKISTLNVKNVYHAVDDYIATQLHSIERIFQ